MENLFNQINECLDLDQIIRGIRSGVPSSGMVQVARFDHSCLPPSCYCKVISGGMVARQAYAHGDDGVDLDFDAPLFGPLNDLEYIIDMGRTGPVFRTTLFDVGLCVERITRYGHDVEILTVCVQPFLGHLRAVVHDGTRLDMKLFFTELEDLPDIARLKKGFTAADVEFLHPRIDKHAKSTLGILKRENKLVRVGVEAKVAFVVATPVWKPIHRNGYLRRCCVEERN